MAQFIELLVSDHNHEVKGRVIYSAFINVDEIGRVTVTNLGKCEVCMRNGDNVWTEKSYQEVVDLIKDVTGEKYDIAIAERKEPEDVRGNGEVGLGSNHC